MYETAGRGQEHHGGDDLDRVRRPLDRDAAPAAVPGAPGPPRLPADIGVSVTPWSTTFSADAYRDR